jgi:hypothetical protein
MKFKEYLNEQLINESQKDDVILIISDMSDTELSEFGSWLYDEMFGDDDSYTEDEFSKEEIIEMLNDVDVSDLEYILDMLNYEEVDTEIDENKNMKNVIRKNAKKKRKYKRLNKASLNKQKKRQKALGTNSRKTALKGGGFKIKDKFKNPSQRRKANIKLRRRKINI